MKKLQAKSAPGHIDGAPPTSLLRGPFSPRHQYDRPLVQY